MSDYEQELQSRVESQFAKNTANHNVEIHQDDGLYRHLKCTNNGSQVYRFDLITWPGHLTITGDMGCYTWARVPDMFAFVRGSIKSTSYFTEKLKAAELSGISEYDGALYTELLEYLKDEHPSEVAQLPPAPETLQEACDVLYNSDIPDVWEHFGSLESHTFHYRWILLAVEWAVAEYDKAVG